MVKEITLNYKLGSEFFKEIMGGAYKTKIKRIGVTVYKDLTPIAHRVWYYDGNNERSMDSTKLKLIENKTKYSFDPLFDIGEKVYVYNNYLIDGAKLELEEVRGYTLYFSYNFVKQTVDVEIEYITNSVNNEKYIFKSPEDFLKFVTRDLK